MTKRIRNVVFVSWMSWSGKSTLACEFPNAMYVDWFQLDDEFLFNRVMNKINEWVDAEFKTIVMDEVMHRLTKPEKDSVYAKIEAVVESFWTHFILVAQSFEDFKGREYTFN